MILSSDSDLREYHQSGGWGDRTLLDLLDEAVRAVPDRVALVDAPNRTEIDGQPERRLTWREVADGVDRFALVLLEAGVGRDDRVMVQLPNVVELVLACLAAGRIGAIVTPVPVQYRAHELRQVLALAEPRAFVTTARAGSAALLDQIESLRAEAPSLAAVIAQGRQLPPSAIPLDARLERPLSSEERARLDAWRAAHPVSADDVFTLCWTSGTEAEPKGVPRSHNHWIAIAWASIDGCEIDAGCHLLCPFPLVNMSGIGGMLVPWLLVAGRLALHHPLSLPVFLRQIATEEIRYTVAPPALLTMLLLQRDLLARFELRSLKNIGSGSAPLSPSMVKEWQERYGIGVVNLFGSNEGTALVSGPRDIPDPEERAECFPRFGAGEKRWSSRITRGLVTRLVDPVTGAVVTEPGVAGELRIRGPAIFSGYWRRPELTRRAFDEEGWYRTGDLFAIAAGKDGALDRYRFAGRLKDVVIRGGNKISSEEVEGLLAAHPAVAEVAVVGYPDAIMGERLCAVVVPRPGQVVELAGLVAWLRERAVASYKLPERVLVVDALPRSPVGKVLKRVLRERLRQPAGPLER